MFKQLDCTLFQQLLSPLALSHLHKTDKGQQPACAHGQASRGKGRETHPCLFGFHGVPWEDDILLSELKEIIFLIF